MNRLLSSRIIRRVKALTFLYTFPELIRPGASALPLTTNSWTTSAACSAILAYHIDQNPISAWKYCIGIPKVPTHTSAYGIGHWYNISMTWPGGSHSCVAYFARDTVWVFHSCLSKCGYHSRVLSTQLFLGILQGTHNVGYMFPRDTCISGHVTVHESHYVASICDIHFIHQNYAQLHKIYQPDYWPLIDDPI